MNDPEILQLDGAFAILGMDLVSFSTLDDDDQIRAIGYLYQWIREALAYHSITEKEYRWSPAGDGGYVTFVSTPGCHKAIDATFSISEKIQHPDWIPGSGEKLRVRMALHAGLIKEGWDLGRGTNIWGHGINVTARILSVSAPNQVLVSKQYADLYASRRPAEDFTLGELHWRTVKHGFQVEVMNVNRGELGINAQNATAMRWHNIGGLWERTIQDYKSFIHDTLRSNNPVAAIGAAKFLLDLGEREPVWALCEKIGNVDSESLGACPAYTHRLFSQLPPDVLFRVIEKIRPRRLGDGEMLAEIGTREDSAFFIVSGEIAVEMPRSTVKKTVSQGDLIGEFALWIPNLPRTATLRAISDTLVLELHHDEFAPLLACSRDVGNLVYGIIRKRIIENVLTSQPLFPEMSTCLKEGMSYIPAECECYTQGTQLDLEHDTYVLFSGSVEVYPRTDRCLVVESHGVFGSEAVLGLVCRLGKSDGPSGTVLRDSVAVKIDHSVLRDLQDRIPAVRNVWNRLWGQRMGEIEDAIGSKKRVPLPSAADQLRIV